MASSRRRRVRRVSAFQQLRREFPEAKVRLRPGGRVSLEWDDSSGPSFTNGDDLMAWLKSISRKAS